MPSNKEPNVISRKWITSQILLIAQLLLRWAEISRGAAASRLSGPASRTGAHPARRPEAGSWFSVQGIGDDLAVAHSFCRPCRCRIEHIASVFLPGGTQAVDLQRQAVIQITADRTAHYGYAHKLTVLGTAHGIHDDFIGYTLGTACDCPDEATYYLSRALLRCISSLIRITIGYFNVYIQKEDFISAANIVQLALHFFSELREPGQNSYLDKTSTQLYVYLAQAQVGLGNMGGAKESLRMAKTTIQLFVDPDYLGKVLGISTSISFILIPLSLVIAGGMTEILPAFVLPMLNGIVLIIVLGILWFAEYKAGSEVADHSL